MICNKDIRANDASSLRDDGWKTLTDLANTWGSVVLPIDHQYEEYPQVHELMGDRKTLFYKQYRSGNCHPPFGRHLLINKLKKAIKDDKAGPEAAGASTSLLSDASLLNLRSSTTTS